MMKKIKKPPFVSHYLVLSDLLNNIDVRVKSDAVHYLTGRIENIKLDLKKQGIEFIEDVTKQSKFATYKPYILLPTSDNIDKAKKLLDRYATDEVLSFLEQKPYIEVAESKDEAKGSN